MTAPDIRQWTMGSVVLLGILATVWMQQPWIMAGVAWCVLATLLASTSRRPWGHCLLAALACCLHPVVAAVAVAVLSGRPFGHPAMGWAAGAVAFGLGCLALGWSLGLVTGLAVLLGLVVRAVSPGTGSSAGTSVPGQ